MRDFFKNEEYFIKCISYEQERINKFSEALSCIETENIIGRRNALIYLANFNKNLFKLLYSKGDSVEDIYFYYIQWIKNYSEICTENDSIFDVIDMFSIAVFFKKRKKDFENYLIAINNRLDLDEGIINICLCYLEIDFKDNTKSKLSYVNDLLDSENKDESLAKVLNNWYSFHQDAYWYDTHNSKSDTYCGYWSFELGAIAKILNINDKELQYQRYYPYDLVHFNG